MGALLNIIFYFFRILIVLLLPFFLFVRSAVYVHVHYELPGYLSVIIAAMVLIIVLFFYLTIGYRMLFKKGSSGSAMKQRMIFLSLLSFGILIHLLFFVSSKNVQSKDLKGEYLELHPILRLATGIFTKLDRSLVMTDISRKHGDYERMGLPENAGSLHYPQRDGYAYAIDLRTRDKSEIFNFGMKWYYKLLGFDTLRHIGTGDHLHVSLHCPSKYRK